jgi:hypothetical protein
MENITSPAGPQAHSRTADAPRTLSRQAMRAHEETGEAVPLSSRDRDRVFVRYDHSWWIGDRDGFVEIIDAEQTQKLDRWHQRLSYGALWA